jgi:antitoxin (DNA-binding transcriptional repressor) of toxin-antitoxin stability system
MVMKKVRIADLKSRLSAYLLAVSRGDTITVVDGQMLVAQILPIQQESVLHVHEPAPDTPTPNRIPPPKPLNLKIDIVELLLEERQRLR